MNIKFLFRFVLYLSFVTFPFLAYGMQEKKSIVSECNDQLLDTIKHINLNRAERYGNMIASDGHRIKNCMKINDPDHNLKDKLFLDCRPLENNVIYNNNNNNNVIKSHVYYSFCYYSSCCKHKKFDCCKCNKKNKKVDNFELINRPVTWIGPTKNDCQSLNSLSVRNLFETKSYDDIISYLENIKKSSTSDVFNKYVYYILFDPRVPKVELEKKLNIIEKYVASAQDKVNYENFVELSSKNLEKYLKQKFTIENGCLDSELPNIMEKIGIYLDNGADITIAIRRCIVCNDFLFSGGNTSDKNKVTLSLDQSTELAKFLLCTRNGWEYLACTLANNYYSKYFMRYLALIRAYKVFSQAKKQMESVVYDLAYNGCNLKRLSLIIDQGLYTEDTLNKALLKCIKRGRRYSEMICLLIKSGANNFDEALRLAGKNINQQECIKILLDEGANPNELFYRNKQGEKCCYLSSIWGHNYNTGFYKGTENLLFRVLLDSRRVRDEDETSDIKYIKDQNIQSVYSVFDNGKDKGQKDLFEYVIKAYKLAFEALKTKDTRKLCKHIMEQKRLYDSLPCKQENQKLGQEDQELKNQRERMKKLNRECKELKQEIQKFEQENKRREKCTIKFGALIFSVLTGVPLYYILYKDEGSES